MSYAHTGMLLLVDLSHQQGVEEGSALPDLLKPNVATTLPRMASVTNDRGNTDADEEFDRWANFFSLEKSELSDISICEREKKIVALCLNQCERRSLLLHLPKNVDCVMLKKTKVSHPILCLFENQFLGFA